MDDRLKVHQCGDTMKEVWKMTTDNGHPEFRGWYCPTCQYFDSAIGRERRWTFHQGRPHRVNGG